MAIDEVVGQPWARRHDDAAVPRVRSAPRKVFPKSLEEVVDICANFRPGITAAGSHWALSDVAVADSVFVETHDPDELHPSMGKTLFEVVPGCLSDEFLEFLAHQTPPPYDSESFELNGGIYLVHFETGKRIYQLYAELDHGHDDSPESLAVLLRDRYGNAGYLGPWAFPTLGGAGGQTVFGALTTGTHGGDFRLPPIADSVLAIHLVADGGRHYWIEPGTPTFGMRLTDEDKLTALYRRVRPRRRRTPGDANFEIVRDDDLFTAVLVGAGRFGIVYSVVTRAVRQYSLHQERRLTTWQDVRSKIGDLSSDLYQIDPAHAPHESRFLQIAVCLTPHHNFTRNLAGVTKRWNVGLATDPASGEPYGRSERVGAVVQAFDAAIQGPRFALAGRSHPYVPDRASRASGGNATFLERACSDASFMKGVIEAVADEIQEFINSSGAKIGAGIAAVLAAGLGVVVSALIPWLTIVLVALLGFLYLLRSLARPRLGHVLDDLRVTLLGNPEPDARAAGLFVWHMICYQIFATLQGKQDYEAISYAVMDGNDYRDRSCFVNGDSMEVFFDVTNPQLVAFVDALITFEIGQEVLWGRSFLGYASLRFTGSTRALLGEQRFPLTCVVEVSGARDVDGGSELMDFAMTLALDPNFAGILHWGQRNDSNRRQIEARFGDTAIAPTGSLRVWRDSLSRITRHGRLDGFSNAFTRRTGLEIVTPRIYAFDQVGPVPQRGNAFTVSWDCGDNPATTALTLHVTSPNGGRISYPSLALIGQQQVPATESGTFELHLVATIILGGERRDASRTLDVPIA